MSLQAAIELNSRKKARLKSQLLAGPLIAPFEDGRACHKYLSQSCLEWFRVTRGPIFESTDAYTREKIWQNITQT